MMESFVRTVQLLASFLVTLHVPPVRYFEEVDESVIMLAAAKIYDFAFTLNGEIIFKK